MITAEQRRYVESYAYVPEHLPAYVTAITGARPHLIGDCLAYTAGERLIFVGYPLRGSAYDEAAWLAALDTAIARFRPQFIAITAAALPATLGDCPPAQPDAYYRLDLAGVRPSKKVRNLLRRAGREVTVHQATRFGPEHERLVTDFLADVPVDEGTRYVFERLARYAGARGSLRARLWGAIQGASSHHGLPLAAGRAVQAPGAARLLEARNAEGRLLAFDIATCAAGEYAFYLFNFRDRQAYVPGTSDLLLARLIELAQREGKRYLNLGLGINAGVSHFKEKWGAEPFLAHISCVRERTRAAWEEALTGM